MKARRHHMLGCAAAIAFAACCGAGPTDRTAPDVAAVSAKVAATIFGDETIAIGKPDTVTPERDDTPFLSEHIAGHELWRFDVEGSRLEEKAHIDGLAAFDVAILAEPETGRVLKVVATRRQGDRITLPYPDAQAATGRLSGRGPEIWRDFVDAPGVPLVRAMNPEWTAQDGVLVPAPIPGLADATEWVAHCVELSFGPNAEPTRNWVFHIRGLPTPTANAERLAVGTRRVRVDADSGRWVHSGNALGVVITRQTLEDAGLLSPTDSDERAKEVARAVLTATRTGKRPGTTPTTDGAARPSGTFPGIPFTGNFTCTLALSSLKDATQVPPAAPIDWTITAELEDVGNPLGLAGVIVNLVPSPSNPTAAALLPAGAVPPSMSGFASPSGISNPTAGGYGGTVVGDALLEIGGMQNTFGVQLLGGVGTDTSVDIGIAIPGSPQVIASGTFQAPNPAGTYAFSIEGGFANVLSSAGVAPELTFVRTAEISYAPGTISFTIECVADINHDDVLNLDDVDAFAQAFVANDLLADLDANGTLNLDDVVIFAEAFPAGCP
ncbi:MAG: GC-type dockerin domain-anchored protein [Phycisphaerales bacterium]